jgi:hypothetical protein
MKDWDNREISIINKEERIKNSIFNKKYRRYISKIKIRLIIKKKIFLKEIDIYFLDILNL